jgi:hypothetical protein
MAINILEWRCCFHRRKLLTRVPRQEDPGWLPKCSLTEDSEFFGSEECNEHSSSAEWFIDPVSTSPKKFGESNVIRTMVD